MWRLLRAGAYRWVWAGESVSMAGDRVQEIAMAWLVLSVTGSPVMLGAVLAAGAIPRAFLLLVGGAVTDVLSPRNVMIASNLIRGALAALLAGVVLGGSVQLWQLFAVEIAFGVSDAFFYPAAGSIIPTLVDKDNLPAANALLGSSEQVTMLVGPAIGGVLVAALGTPGAFLVNAGSFLCAAGGALAARGASRLSEPATVGLLARVRRGLGYVWSDRQLRVLLLLISAASLTYNGVFAVGLPGLARARFPEGPVALGAMLGAWGAGQLAGVLSAGITGLPRRWGRLVIAVALGESAVFVLLGMTPTYWSAAVLLAILGFAVAYASDVAIPSWIQRRADPQMLGRIVSMVELPRQSLAPVSFLVMGVLAGRSLALAFAWAGTVMLIVALVAIRSKDVRELSW